MLRERRRGKIPWAHREIPRVQRERERDSLGSERERFPGHREIPWAQGEREISWAQRERERDSLGSEREREIPWAEREREREIPWAQRERFPGFRER